MRPNQLENAIERSICQAIEDDLREKLGGVRDPKTGEFPVIAMRGDSLENLSLEVSGSPDIVRLVEERLKDDFDMTVSSSTNAESEATKAGSEPPCAFLCHGSEDKSVARRIAKKLQANGIETFFDEWEIRSGDSLRQKIDHGLSACTHFIVLVTETSISKPWVNAEIDAAFVQKVSGQCRFIPLRRNLDAEQLPPLLAALHAPSVDDFDADIHRLIADIYGLSDKPPLGEPVSAMQDRHALGAGLSAAAEVIAQLMVERSDNGLTADPQISAEQLKAATKLPDDDIVDAVDELRSRGLLRRHQALGMGPLGFIRVVPQAALFSELDEYFTDRNPSKDALRVATRLLNADTDGLNVSELATRFEWVPRRMNPAVSFLIDRRLVDFSKAMGTHPWCTSWIRRTAATRRWVRSQS